MGANRFGRGGVTTLQMKQRCDDQVGDAKSACKKEAKAERDMAEANAKLESQSPAARSKRFDAATAPQPQQQQPQQPQQQQPQTNTTQ